MSGDRGADASLDAAALPRHSALVRTTHWITAISFLGLLVSGVAILLAHPRMYWGETGALGTPSLFDFPLSLTLGHSGWGRYLHFLSAWVCVVAGLVYVLTGLFTGRFRRDLLPAKRSLTWRHFSRVIFDHLRLKRAGEEDFRRYNVMQQLTYLAVVFFLFPLMVWTGLAMSPAITSVFPSVVTVFGGQQSARTIHFVVTSFLVLFLFVHVAMLCISGFGTRVRAMITGYGAPTERVRIGNTLTRRKLITTGLTAAAGTSTLGITALVANRYGLIPPDYGGIYGVGETLTYAAQRAFMARQSLAREFDRGEISKVTPVNGWPPETDTYQRLLAGGFAEWRLMVDGLVARPASFSLAELKRLPRRSHITHQACEEGWSFIAESTGVPLSYVLNLVGIRPEARYVVFFPFDDFWDSIDMLDAFHPQTLLAYGMNGEELPTPHGAPVRLRVSRQLGYKSIKYLSRITVTDTRKNIGAGIGSKGVELGYSWYAGI